ncbi:hypothetical protein [Burkholderia lata]
MQTVVDVRIDGRAYMRDMIRNALSTWQPRDRLRPKCRASQTRAAFRLH